MFVKSAEEAKSLSICKSLAYTLAAQYLLAVDFVALEDFLEGVLFGRVTRLPTINVLWLFCRIVASHF
jgi:hypothetical protein